MDRKIKLCRGNELKERYGLNPEKNEIKPADMVVVEFEIKKFKVMTYDVFCKLLKDDTLGKTMAEPRK